MDRNEIDALCEQIERELCHLPSEEPCGCPLCSKIYPAIPALRQLQAENAALKERVEALEWAVKPFTEFIEGYDTQPNRHQSDVIYQFENRAGINTLRLSEIRAVTAFAKGTPHAE